MRVIGTLANQSIGQIIGWTVYQDDVPLVPTTSVPSYDVTGLQPSTLYHFQVQGFDAAGLTTDLSERIEVTTLANSAPVWSNPGTQNLTVGQAYSLNLLLYASDADEDAITTSVVSGSFPSGITKSGNVISGTPTTGGQSTSVTLSVSDGTASIQVTIAFTTVAIDTTAPTVPMGLAQTSATATSITIDWTASTDVSGILHYRIWRSATLGGSYGLRGTSASTSFTDPGLGAAQTWFYKVSAVDNSANQNESALSTAVSATSAASSSSAAEQDWINRSQGALVVNANDFREDAELDYFIRGENTAGALVTNPSPRPPGSLTLVATPFGNSRAIRSKAFGTTLTATVPAGADYPAHTTQVWPVANAADIPDPAGTPYQILVGNGTDSGGIEWIEVQSVNVGANTVTVRRKMSAENGGYGTNTAPSFPAGFTLGRGPNGSWNRPLGAFPAGQNGRSVPDIGIANGTVTKQRAWTGNTVNSSAHTNFREAYFGHRSYWADAPQTYRNWTPQDGGGTRTDAWDGDEFYWQFRAKISATRFNAPSAKMLFIQNAATSGSGQFFWTVGGNQYGEQPPPNEKLAGVTYGTYLVGLTSYADSAAPAGGILGSVQTDSIDNNQPIQDGYPNSKWNQRPSNFLAWCFPADRYVTYLLHFKFGKDNATADPSDTLPFPTPPFPAASDASYRTTFELYVADEGDATYKLITSDDDFVWFFGDGKFSPGTYFYNPPGLNVLWMSQNLNDYVGAGSVSPPPAPHWIDYTQSIVSKGTIPVPITAPDYIFGMSPFEMQTLSSVSNGKPTFREGASAAWQADPSITPEGTSSPQTQHLHAVTNFSGGAGDGRRGYLYAHGGGHGDGAYNGLLRFDFNGTTQATGWTELPNSASPPSAVTALSSIYTDGKPTSIHSYDQLALDPVRNIFYRTGGSSWGGSGGANTHTWKFDLNTNGPWTQLANQPSLFDLGACVIFDPGSNKFYICRQNNVSHFYRATPNTWSSGSAMFSGGGFSFTACLDTRRNRFIVVGTNTGTVRKDLANINWATDTVSGITSFTPTGASCPLFNDEGVGICYDDLLDCYWLFGGKATPFTHIYRMNASTFAVTAHALSAAIPNSSAEFSGLWKRFCFQSNWRMIGVAITHNQPVYVIRLPSS